MLLGEESKCIWLGAIFLFLGVLGIVLGQLEERSYESALSRRFDLREFIERIPKWPQPRSLRVGGVISIAVGVVLLVIGLVSYFHWPS